MKLITLNTWGNKAGKDFHGFLSKYSNSNIWFFQEIFNNADDSYDWNEKANDKKFYETLNNYLPEKNGFFCPTAGEVYGLATFLDKNIEVIDKGEVLVARGTWPENKEITEETDHHRKLQWLEVKINGKKLLLAHVHLTHRPKGKGDSEKRLRQSRLIADFLALFDCPKILAGDFNLTPDTESIQIIEKSGMRNLIKDFNITSTRTDIYKNEIRFADYVFISPDITIKNFEVLPDVVSDHSPLLLDFEI